MVHNPIGTYKPYLKFIRYSLNPKGDMPEDMMKMDWEGFFQFADEQGILGLMYDGRRMMADEAGMRDDEGFLDDLTLEWGFVAQQIEEQNKAVNVAAVKLLKSLKEQGLDGCILKGQGNSLLYPKPYRRTPGDIDVWVKRQNDIRTDIKDIIRYVKDRNQEARAIYHHIDGGEIGGIEVEVHYRPSFMNNLIHNRRMQKWFGEKADEQFRHYVELPDGVGTIYVPTMDFNTVYLLAHVYHHLLHEGIGLRQIIDYYYLLRGTDYNGTQRHGDTEILLRRLGLWKIAGAMMWVLKEVLLMDEGWMIANPDEKRGRILLDIIMMGGNFGHFSAEIQKGFSFVGSLKQHIWKYELLRFDARETIWGELNFYGQFIVSIPERIRRRSWTLR